MKADLPGASNDPEPRESAPLTPDLRRQLHLGKEPPASAEIEVDWEDGKQDDSRAILGIGLAILVALGAVLWLLSRNPGNMDQASNPRPTPVPPAAVEPQELQEVVEVVRMFMEAETDEERALLTIAPGETLPKMREFHDRPGNRPPRGFGEMLDVGPAAFDGYPMHMAVATEADGHTTRLFSVFRVGGRSLIDWESSVGYGGTSPKTFIEDKPTAPVQMRVYLKRGHYYNHAYADDAVWAHYQLSFRGGEGFLDAYAERDSRVAQELEVVVRPGAVQPVFVTLRWDDHGRAVRISRFIHPYWVDLERLRMLDRQRSRMPAHD